MNKHMFYTIDLDLPQVEGTVQIGKVLFGYTQVEFANDEEPVPPDGFVNFVELTTGKPEQPKKESGPGPNQEFNKEAVVQGVQDFLASENAASYQDLDKEVVTERSPLCRESKATLEAVGTHFGIDLDRRRSKYDMLVELYAVILA